LQLLFNFFFKTSYLHEEANCTELSSSVSVPWFRLHTTHQKQAGDDEKEAAAEQGEDAGHQQKVPDYKKGLNFRQKYTVTFQTGAQRYETFCISNIKMERIFYEESVVDKFKSNLLLMIIWLNIINYNS
jgi:hypothetical protein